MSGAHCPICGGLPARQGAVDIYPLQVCPDCGLEFLDPPPDDAALAAIYGRHYYDAWGIRRDETAVRALKMATFRQRIAQVRPLLPAGAHVLDVGCATGYFLEAAREAGWDAFGVELSAYGAETCRAKVGAGHVFQGQLEDAQFADRPDGRFDAIFMSDLIEHVRDPQRTLAAAHQRLAATGLLVITTPWTASLTRRLAGRRWLHYKPEHLYYFGPASLPRLLAEGGFEVLAVTPAGKSLSLGYALAQWSARSGLARLLGRLPRRLLDWPLRLQIGEATVVARRRTLPADTSTSPPEPR